MTKNIAKTLNMNPIQPTATEPKQIIDEELIDDIRQARRDIKEVAAIGIQAVAEAAQLASQSQHDKLYMALSSVMKSTIEANRELIETHRSQIQLSGENEVENVVQNNLFVGSTAELLEMLEKKAK